MIACAIAVGCSPSSVSKETHLKQIQHAIALAGGETNILNESRTLFARFVQNTNPAVIYAVEDPELRGFSAITNLGDVFFYSSTEPDRIRIRIHNSHSDTYFIYLLNPDRPEPAGFERIAGNVGFINPTAGDFVAQVATVCPAGWHVSAGSNVVVLRREAALWIMGKVSNPPRGPEESVEHYFKTAGHEIHYEVRLRFVPLLSAKEYEALKTAREQAAAQLDKGASGKSEYTQLQRNFERSQVPRFYTGNYSVFVERWADRGTNFGYRMEPRFIDVYPPEAGSEIESVINSLSRIFTEYAVPER